MEDPEEKEEKKFEYTFGRELAFNHLTEKHSRLLLHVDSLDLKLSQSIALNGVILSFVFFRMNEAHSTWIFALGISLILISTVIGVYAFLGKKYLDGLSEEFFEDKEKEKFTDFKIYQTIESRLIKDLIYNREVQRKKAKLFNFMIIICAGGLISLIVGYYA